MGTTKWLLVAGAVLALACTGDGPTGPTKLASTAVEPAVVLAAGDVAGSSSSYHHEETSDLLMAEPDALVLLLGDNVYPDGLRSGYDAYYHPWWGRAKNRTWPVPGNHDYHAIGQPAGAPGYYGYFGSRAPGQYYARDIGPWRWYFLNSELGTGGTDANSPQARWLKADLAANPRTCVGASIHRPWLASYGGDRVAHQPSTYLLPLQRSSTRAGPICSWLGTSTSTSDTLPPTLTGHPRPAGYGNLSSVRVAPAWRQRCRPRLHGRVRKSSSRPSGYCASI